MEFIKPASPFLVLLSAELAYYVYMKAFVIPRYQKTEPRKHPPQFEHPSAVLRQIYHDCTLSLYSFEKWARLGFLGTDVSKIGTQNFDSLLAWFMYVSRFEDLTEEEQTIVVELRKEAVDRFGYPNIEGYVPDLPHYMLGRNEFSPNHFPLTGHALLAGIEGGYKCILFGRGFRKYTDAGISYWFFEKPNSTKCPVVFLHGIGAGLWVYSSLIAELCKTRSVILISYECILLHSNLFHVSNKRVPDHTQLSQCVLSIIDRFHISTIAVMGHSWGTFLAGWLIKTIPEKITHLTLIDPVALFVPYPDTSYFMVYKPPANWKERIFQTVVRGNVNIGYTLSRHFAWYNMALGLHEIPENIGVFISLSENDEMLDIPFAVEKIKQFAGIGGRTAPIQYVICKNRGHGESTERQRMTPIYCKLFRISTSGYS